VALLETILYPNTYAPNLDGCHVEMRVLGNLLSDKAPKLAKHLQVCVCVFMFVCVVCVCDMAVAAATERFRALGFAF